MEHRDPRSLIRDSARRTRRRERANLLLPLLPPLAAIAFLLAAGRVPPEVVAAVTIVAALVLVRASSLSLPERAVAGRLDRALDGRDRFLTIATLEPTNDSRLLPLVAAETAGLAARAKPAEILPPIAWRRPLATFFLSALAVLALWLGTAPAAAPTDRLRGIADVLAAAGDPGNAAVARAIREALEVLRDPKRSREEKRAAAQEALAEIDREERDRQGGQGQAQGGGQSESERMTGEARDELRQLAGDGSAGGQEDGEGEEREASGDRNGQDAEGGGIQGPERPRGAGERPGERAGNRPGSGEGESREQRATGGEPRPGEAGETPEERGEEPRPAPRPDLAGAGGESGRPDPGSTGPTEQQAEAGEGPDGWRIVDGAYVRVRIPDEGEALETERVRKPGRVEAGVPYGNVPLPAPGGPGEVEEKQPLPIEYRDVLGGGEGRKR